MAKTLVALRRINSVIEGTFKNRGWGVLSVSSEDRSLRGHVCFVCLLTYQRAAWALSLPLLCLRCAGVHHAFTQL